MKKNLPLLAVECYLILTLVIFYFGPVKFRLHNQFIFFELLFVFLIIYFSGFLDAITGLIFLGVFPVMIFGLAIHKISYF